MTGVHPVSCPMGTGAFFPEVKRQRPEVLYLSPVARSRLHHNMPPIPSTSYNVLFNPEKGITSIFIQICWNLHRLMSSCTFLYWFHDVLWANYKPGGNRDSAVGIESRLGADRHLNRSPIAGRVKVLFSTTATLALRST